MVQLHDDPLGKVQLGADGVFVHHGASHCTQTHSLTGQIDVLGHVACIHSAILIVSTTVALVAYQQQGKRSIQHEILTSSKILQDVFFRYLGECVVLGIE